MAIPEFISALRAHVGTAPLWLSGASGVILRDGELGQEVLLVQRADTGEWSLVSGIVDPGEHPATTLVREAVEETGVTISIERMLWLTVADEVTYDNGDRCRYLDHGFMARWASGEAFVGDDESSAVGWFDVDDLPEPGRGPLAERVRLALDAPQDVRFDI